MEAAGLVLAQLGHVLLAAGALAVAGHILAGARHRRPPGIAIVAPLVLTACWSLAEAALGAGHLATKELIGCAHLAWLWLLYRLFALDDRDSGQRMVRPMVVALALVGLLHLVLVTVAGPVPGHLPQGQLVQQFAATFRLLFCVGALFLVHNLYASTASATRPALRWPAAALGLLWLGDLNLAAMAYLDGAAPVLLVHLRTPVQIGVVGLLWLHVLRPADTARFRPSRTFAFSSVSLLAIGGYLLVLVLMTRALGSIGRDMAWMAQAGFLATAGALALVVLPSQRLRGHVRVLLSKHLFQHRYDYRGEWLRFTATMGQSGEQETLHQRIVQAVADVTDSPAGVLLLPAEGGGLSAGAAWHWPDLDIPAEAMDPAWTDHVQRSRHILDLDDARRGQWADGGREQGGQPAHALPGWLLDRADAWALVPLIHFDRLVGLVVLARPSVSRRLDWEDFDLLRVIGRQLASYLAEQASHDALREVQKFDEFNRRIAFVMHDIKNLASQLSLLARNAERHADNPDFRGDMLVTLRNSADKLETLLARLGRYRSQGSDSRGPVDLAELAHRIAVARGTGSGLVIDATARVLALADGQALEQALIHLVHNAVEAGPPGATVLLAVRQTGQQAVIEVIDSGCGMSAEFIRARLFRPFQSTKADGFGIGTYEARELVHGMGGRLQVESREGVGTRFVLSLPVAPADLSGASPVTHMAEVA